MDTKLRRLWAIEWQRRRMPFLVCLVWMIGGVIYNIAYELTARFRAPVASFDVTAMLFGMVMPIFVAMKTSLGEITDRTRSFDDALPISVRARGWVRLLGGMAVLIVPILAGAVLMSACVGTGWLEQAATRPSDDATYVGLPQRASLSPLAAVGLVWQVTALVAWSTVALYLLLSALGTMLRVESHAGFAGAAVAAAWFVGYALHSELVWNGHPTLATWSGAIAPQGLITNFSYGHERGSYGDLLVTDPSLLPLAVNMLLLTGLTVLFVRRYARGLSRGAAVLERDGARRTWWRPTFRLGTRLTALLWLAARQSLPMCLPGLVIAALMTPFQLSAIALDRNDPLLSRLSDALPSSMWVVGLVWSVVVGAGIFAAEIDARLAEFWRALPMPAWQLFAVKFAGGLLAVLLVLDVTTIAVSWRSPNWGKYESMNWPYIACFLPFHATMFAVAVAWTCVLRRAVLGGMAAIVMLALTMIALEWSSVTREFDPIEVYNNLAHRTPPGTPLDFTAHGFPAVSAALAFVTFASIMIGWRALSRYDPRRQTG